MEFEVGQHVWLNIQDFKMPKGLAPHFNPKYARPYEILHKLHLIHFKVEDSTFCILKLNFFYMMNIG